MYKRASSSRSGETLVVIPAHLELREGIHEAADHAHDHELSHWFADWTFEQAKSKDSCRDLLGKEGTRRRFEIFSPCGNNNDVTRGIAPVRLLVA